MKRKTKTILASIAAMVFLSSGLFTFFAWISATHVAHGRPYRWDAWVLPGEVFSNATVGEVVAQVNALVAKTSNGSVTQAVYLDRTPAKIETLPSDSPLKSEMDVLIAGYRQDETNWLNRGACGFETCRYTGKFLPRHSLGCQFQELASWVQMDYEEKPDAIHLARNPSHLECRAYKISSKLKQMAEDLNGQNNIRLGTEPITSAFIDVTRVGLWSIDVPTRPNATTGEFRYASIFKYLPEKSILLVIETPEAHSTAVTKLKEQGLLDGQ